MNHSGPRGPAVWLGLDQQALDDAYNQAVYAPNMAQVMQRYADNSAAVRRRLGAPLRFAYGESPIEALDVYTAPQPGAPIAVFIHGGAWRSGEARDYAFAAEFFVRAGAHFVVPDFAPVQDLDGNLAVMAAQVRRAVAWVFRNASRFDGDARRIHVLGHSSGAHLAGVALTTDWPGIFGLPTDLIKGGFCCSGIFDLQPVRLSARSRYVKITDEIEQACSPLRHLNHLNAPLILGWGTLETPEFIRQSREFAAAVSASGKPIQTLEVKGVNHFEVIESLADPASPLGQAALQQMELGAD